VERGARARQRNLYGIAALGDGGRWSRFVAAGVGVRILEGAENPIARVSQPSAIARLWLAVIRLPLAFSPE
jgi:hypothetical protein